MSAPLRSRTTAFLFRAMFSLALSAIGACDSADGGGLTTPTPTPTPDDSTNDGAGGSVPQPSPTPDGCQIPLSQTDCAPTDVTVSFEGTAAAPTNLETEISLDRDGLEMQLRIQTYAGYAPFGETVTLGEYTLTETEASFETCGLCIVLLQGDDGTGQAQNTLMPVSGRLFIEQISPVLQIRLEDAAFRPVQIDAQSFVTTETQGDCPTEVWTCGIQGSSD